MTRASLSEVALRVSGDHQMLALLGERDSFLRLVEEAFPDAQIVARGTELRIAADDVTARHVKTVFEELLVLVRENQRLDADRVKRVIDLVRADVPSPSAVFTEGISVGRG